jgi:sec-independent protein translocase protein TatB
MLDFDAGKLIVIGIVALVAIPSKDLPRVLRQLGQLTGKVRRMATEFQNQFLEALRESEFEEVKRDVEHSVGSVVQDVRRDASFDPLTAARKEIERAIEVPPASDTPPLAPPLTAAEPRREA